MLGYLKGCILQNAVLEEGTVTLGVGSSENGFVGYSVRVPSKPSYELLGGEKLVELFIYTHVREDVLDLYGFATRMEKELFLALLSVNGIGPKGALAILSGAEPERLIEAIIEGEKEMLTKIPGIGKKTAERVLLELAEPLKKKMAQNPLGHGRPAHAGAASAAQSQSLRDAVSALVSLGFRENDVTPVVSRALSEAEGGKHAPKAEDLIKTALRQLA